MKVETTVGSWVVRSVDKKVVKWVGTTAYMTAE